jgi:hypothetical protein
VKPRWVDKTFVKVQGPHSQSSLAFLTNFWNFSRMKYTQLCVSSAINFTFECQPNGRFKIKNFSQKFSLIVLSLGLKIP